MSQLKDERTVVLSEVNDTDAGKRLEVEKPFSGLVDAVIKYTRVDNYTTFTAEYALKDGDLVIHFFLPQEMKSDGATPYWLQVFPAHLDAVARDYFNADSPRLQAKYTEELESWWFRGRSYGYLVDVDRFVGGFLEKLDRALDQKN